MQVAVAMENGCLHFSSVARCEGPCGTVNVPQIIVMWRAGSVDHLKASSFEEKRIYSV